MIEKGKNNLNPKCYVRVSITSISRSIKVESVKNSRGDQSPWKDSYDYSEGVPCFSVSVAPVQQSMLRAQRGFQVSLLRSTLIMPIIYFHHVHTNMPHRIYNLFYIYIYYFLYIKIFRIVSTNYRNSVKFLSFIFRFPSIQSSMFLFPVLANRADNARS